MPIKRKLTSSDKMELYKQRLLQGQGEHEAILNGVVSCESNNPIMHSVKTETDLEISPVLSKDGALFSVTTGRISKERALDINARDWKQSTELKLRCLTE